jgi:hypothetical protein
LYSRARSGALTEASPAKRTGLDPRENKVNPMRFIAILVLAAAFSAGAQEVPGRVGRVSYLDGSVAIYQDPEVGWEQASVNAPLTSQNSLWTEPGAHAEVRVSAVAVRLDGATQMDVSRLDDDAMEASIVSGSVAVRVRHNEYGSRYSFDTPEARFTLSREGRYRIDVDGDAQQTRLAVFAGEASIEGPQGARTVQAGQLAVLSGGNFIVDRVAASELDRWADARDRDWVESRSTQYVSTFMTGYEQLDPYGQWIQEPGYGALWVPTQVATDWVPYRYGRWAYVRPWGWTWIDDQPWGYAPFHYGRWVHVRDRWCWYPGQREARPAWAPALVAWVGGSGWTVSASSGPVMGWYPLAPNEAYRPWYHASDRYVSRVNAVVVKDDRAAARRDWNQVREWNRERAITAMPRENLIERRPVQASMVRVSQEAARTVQAAQPQALAPSNTEIQRMRAARSRTAPPSMAAQPAPRGNAPAARGMQRPAAANPQNNAAPQMPQAPIAREPSPGPSMREGRQQGQPQRAQQQPQPQQAAPAAQANPLSRGEAPRERAQEAQRAPEAQQPQQRQPQQAQPRPQQEAQRQQREAQQPQQRQQHEAPQQQPQQGQHQQAQPQQGNPASRGEEHRGGPHEQGHDKDDKGEKR